MKSNSPTSFFPSEIYSCSINFQPGGEKLKKKKAKSSFRGLIPISGLGQTGQKGASPSLAPLAGFAIEKQAKELGESHRNPKYPCIKIVPLDDGTWYCPLCGEKNTGSFCKGCGFESN